MDETMNNPKKGDMAKAMKKKTDEHYASMSKGFKAVSPENSMLESVNEPKLYFPNFRIKLKDLPEAKKWKVGEKYNLELSVEMSSIRDSKTEDGSVEFNVLGIKTDD